MKVIETVNADRLLAWLAAEERQARGLAERALDGGTRLRNQGRAEQCRVTANWIRDELGEEWDEVTGADARD